MLQIRGLYNVAIPVRQLHTLVPKTDSRPSTDEANLDRATAVLGECGVPTRGPIFHKRIPGKSLYFEDLDGHELELFAPSRPSLREPSYGEGSSKG
jgi:hypothetical protein